MFELRFHPAVKKDLKKIEKSVADEIRGSHFVKIKEHPFVAENLLYIFKLLIGMGLKIDKELIYVKVKNWE